MLGIGAFLGILRLIAKGDAHRLASMTWKNRLLGELTLTYRTKDGAETSEQEPSATAAKAARYPAWRRWWLKLRRRE